MSALSFYLSEALLDHVFRGAAYAQPTSVWVALYTTATDDAAAGDEVSGFAYARVEVPCVAGNWSAPAGNPRTISNVNAIVFPTATGGDWGEVTHVGIHDAAVGGNRLYHGPVAVAADVNDGQAWSFLPGELELSLT